MEKITVNTGESSYSITIASGLFNDSSSFSPLKMGDKVMLVTNKTIARFYLNKVLLTLEKAGIKADNIILPDGEQYKNLIVLNMIFTALLKNLHGRDTTLIALGGGVIGDLTGLAASIYQRGVNFIQVSTTLLSQVDSSVGGKTAVNHPLGKNMIGTFYQPISVVIDLDCLKTLPIRELASGLAEVIKYAIVMDKEFFYWLEENIEALLYLENNAIFYCIRHCCKLKASIITKDERENGLRTLLNLGHTYAHAIEANIGYGKWLHGEAVAVGMIIAAYTSERLGQIKKEETQRIIKLLKRAGLPVMLPKEVPIQTYLPYIMRDKKILADELRLVIPITIGKSEVRNGISQEIILNAIKDCHKI